LPIIANVGIVGLYFDDDNDDDDDDCIGNSIAFCVCGGQWVSIISLLRGMLRIKDSGRTKVAKKDQSRKW